MENPNKNNIILDKAKNFGKFIRLNHFSELFEIIPEFIVDINSFITYKY